MFALLPFLFVFAPAAPATPNEFQILQHVKLNVQGELALAANYTCVQTMERAYYEAPRACVANVPHPKPRQYMRDRLRLDVAVSEGSEIFSWHGETKFTSSNIADIIPNGPRSSGQFVGFLRNIFVNQGVQFTFKGASQWNNKPAYTFDYVVQVLRSTYLLKGRGEATIIPYHGSFSVDADSFELIHLSIIADDIPAFSGICAAETDLDYQIVRISGHESLLPAAFTLKLESDHDLYTLTRNDYTQCREFRGESTLLFTPIDQSAPSTTRHVVDQSLPPGLTLKATLRTEN